VEQIAHVIETVIGTEGVHVAGNSLGGYLASILAAERPDLVKSLSLLNATPFWGFNAPDAQQPKQQEEEGKGENKGGGRQGAKRGIWGWRGQLPAPKTLLGLGGFYFNSLRNPKTIRLMLGGVYHRPSTLDEGLVSEIITAASRSGGPQAFTSILFAPKFPVEFDELLRQSGQAGVPLCLLYGQRDPWITPYWGRRAKRVRQDAVYLELSDTGHCPHHESHASVNRALEAWVRVVESRATVKPLGVRTSSPPSFPSVSASASTVDGADGPELADCMRALVGTYEESDGSEVQLSFVDKPTGLWESIFNNFQVEK
jgi:pimeloyl-ACP methyl ester carboxylesterase